LDTSIRAGSDVLKGDFGGALKEGIDYGRSQLNQSNPLMDKIKNIPVIGKVASGIQTGIENAPLLDGLSISQIKDMGNKALNSADSFRQGDIGNGFKNLGSAGLSLAGTGKLGGTAKTLATGIGKANQVAKVF
jgi:hypothetical protein